MVMADELDVRAQIGVISPVQAHELFLHPIDRVRLAGASLIRRLPRQNTVAVKAGIHTGDGIGAGEDSVSGGDE